MLFETVHGGSQRGGRRCRRLRQYTAKRQRRDDTETTTFKGLFTAYQLNWTELTCCATSRPSFTTRSLVTLVSVTTYCSETKTVRYDTIRYDTVGNAILTGGRKPT